MKEDSYKSKMYSRKKNYIIAAANLFQNRYYTLHYMFSFIIYNIYKSYNNNIRQVVRTTTTTYTHTHILIKRFVCCLLLIIINSGFFTIFFNVHIFIDTKRHSRKQTSLFLSSYCTSFLLSI